MKYELKESDVKNIMNLLNECMDYLKPSFDADYNGQSFIPNDAMRLHIYCDEIYNQLDRLLRENCYSCATQRSTCEHDGVKP